LAALDGAALEPADRRWARILQADLAEGIGDFATMVEAAAAVLAEDDGTDPEASCIAAHFASLVHLAAPERARAALDEVLAQAQDPRLTALVRAFLVLADLSDLADDGPVDIGDLEARLEHLDVVASEDGYERFILHWVGWLYGLARRDGVVAWRWYGAQRRYLEATGMGDTWITTYSWAVTDAVEGLDIRADLRRAYDLAEQEGYRVEGDCLLALAYSLVCQGDPVRAAELLGASISQRFSATAHMPLYRVAVEPVIRRALEPEAFAAAVRRGRATPAVAVLGEHGIGPAAPP
jgi:hypothetical protein